MTDDEEYDTRFSLPAVDDPPATEIGVILLGLDAERLLAGLGLAADTGPAAEPAAVTLLVDQARHGVLDGSTLAAAVEAGRGRWRRVRPELAAADPDVASSSAAVRQAWARAHRMLGAVEACRRAPAVHTYLTACWLRRQEVDRVALAVGAG